MKIELFDTWDKALKAEKSLYDSWMAAKTPAWRIQYAKALYEDSKRFVKCLASLSEGKGKVLDLGSSGVPWFSYLCAEAGMQVYCYDYQEPLEQQILDEKAITYINDDVNNIYKHAAVLKDFDLIYCRGLSPAQKLRNWYDQDFIAIWKAMLSMLTDDGTIYWTQMGSGSGQPDSTRSFFANHTAQYFITFFKSLDVDFRITKYGYMSFKIARRSLAPKWSNYYVGSSEKKTDLLRNDDLASLVKWYALQLQDFYSASGYGLTQNIEIRGKKIPAIIARSLLQDNFQIHDSHIIGALCKKSLKRAQIAV